MKLAIFLATALIIGFALAVFSGFADEDSDGFTKLTSSTATGQYSEDIESKLLSLETQLNAEIQDRQRLEILVEELLEGRWLGEEPETIVEPEQRQVERIDSQIAQQSVQEQRRQRRENISARRIQRLEDAGFQSDQANRILQREEQIRLENLNAQWERRRQEYLDSETADNTNPLREELGDIDYERYLKATGRTASVFVSQLVGNSQASIAGFQAADEIVRYNGERVYNFNDLNAANVKGEMGEIVVVDLIRDGVPMQLSVERGPLGIMGGRRRGNRGR